MAPADSLKSITVCAAEFSIWKASRYESVTFGLICGSTRTVYLTPGVTSGGELEVVVVVEAVLVVEVGGLVVVVGGLLVVPPLGTLEVVLEGGTEDDVFVAAFEECFPKVAPSAPPRTAPNITRRAKSPMTRFLRE